MRSRIHRGRAQLREALEHRGGSAVALAEPEEAPAPRATASRPAVSALHPMNPLNPMNPMNPMRTATSHPGGR